MLKGSILRRHASLRNIATGVVAHSAVNVDNAKQVGLQILQAMEGQTVSEVTLTKKDHAVTMNAKSSVRINGCPVQVDPQIRFRHLVAQQPITSTRIRKKYSDMNSAAFHHLYSRQQDSSCNPTRQLWLMNCRKIIDTSGCGAIGRRKPIFCLFF